MRISGDALQRIVRAIPSHPRLTVDVVSGRFGRFFPPRASGSGLRVIDLDAMTITVRGLADTDSGSRPDILILQCHQHRDEPAYLKALRDSGYEGVIVGWFWDNHHAKDRNRAVADLVDVAVASHDAHAAYLAEHAPLLPSVMLCSTQWSRRDAAELWGVAAASRDRADGLYGGFGRYPGAPRTAWLDQLMASGRYPGLWFANDEGAPPYFKMSGQDRFLHWTRYAVSLCVPYRGDLSNRFFDAWLTGQIPVVTPDIAELSAPWAQLHRDRDFVCAASYDETDIAAAYSHARDLFDAGGVAGQQARHELALNHHLLEHRIARIVMLLCDVVGTSELEERRADGTGVTRAARERPVGTAEEHS
jgi:hypothetical protein